MKWGCNKLMHISVLKNEVIEYLNPKAGENFIDCTLGAGGHAFSILEKNAPNGMVLGIDWDNKSLEIFKNSHSEAELSRLKTAAGNYADIKEIAAKMNFSPINGILMDIGLSSWHFEESKRGFGFLKNETLDMRYDAGGGKTAKDLVNKMTEQELERVISEYGEERFARQIAKKIVLTRRVRELETTFELVEIIKAAIPVRGRHEKVHFATRTFQALRIAVNGELDNLIRALPEAIDVLERNGRIAVISFHSLEDRIVKNMFRQWEAEGKAEILTKKPITPSQEEIGQNPRSRSAKLRAIKKI
jgi:16S rRNA (cytosine1402-N4)-methyltransferase